MVLKVPSSKKYYGCVTLHAGDTPRKCLQLGTAHSVPGGRLRVRDQLDTSRDRLRVRDQLDTSRDRLSVRDERGYCQPARFVGGAA